MVVVLFSGISLLTILISLLFVNNFNWLLNFSILFIVKHNLYLSTLGIVVCSDLNVGLILQFTAIIFSCDSFSDIKMFPT